MTTPSDIALSVLQICNYIGLNAVLPSESNVKDAWKEFIHSKDGKNSVASVVWKDKGIRDEVVSNVRKFYKERRRKEQGR